MTPGKKLCKSVRSRHNAEGRRYVLDGGVSTDDESVDDIVRVRLRVLSIITK